MQTFQPGKSYISTDWFTGGVHYYTCISRTDDTVTFSIVCHEADGIHDAVPETFRVFSDDEKEFVVIYTYQDNENRMYADS